jgi:hypothetical protein
MVELVTEILLWLMAAYVLDNRELTPSSYGNFSSYNDLENGCGTCAEGTEGVFADCQLNEWDFLKNISPSYVYIYSHVPHNDVSVSDGPHIRLWSHKIIIL